MTVTVNALFASVEHPPAEVIIVRVDSTGGAEDEIKQTAIYDKYVLFSNLAPGKYKVLRAVYKQSSGPSGPGVPVGGGFAVGISFAPSATIEFQPEVVQRTISEVPAGKIAYMGDFFAVLKPSFPVSYKVEKSEGDLSEGGKRRAYEMLKTVYSESRWALKLTPPVFGIFVDKLPEYWQETTGADKGVLVLAVGKDSPAAKVGLQTSDVVQKIGERVISDRQSFNEALDQYAGKTVAVKYVRNGTENTTEVAFNQKMEQR